MYLAPIIVFLSYSNLITFDIWVTLPNLKDRSLCETVIRKNYPHKVRILQRGLFNTVVRRFVCYIRSVIFKTIHGWLLTVLGHKFCQQAALIQTLSYSNRIIGHLDVLRKSTLDPSLRHPDFDTSTRVDFQNVNLILPILPSNANEHKPVEIRQNKLMRLQKATKLLVTTSFLQTIE